MNLVNLWHRIFSISSACLIAIDTLMELTEGSIKTRSDSLRDTTSGKRRTSGDVLIISSSLHSEFRSWPSLNLWLVVPFYYLGWEVLESQCGCKGTSDRIEIWAECIGLNVSTWMKSLLAGTYHDSCSPIELDSNHSHLGQKGWRSPICPGIHYKCHTRLIPVLPLYLHFCAW